MKKKLATGLGASIIILTLIMTVGVSSLFAEEGSDSFIGKCGQTIQKGYGVMFDAVADLLGMSQEEIQTEKESGKSIAEIAQEKDVTEQMLVDTKLEAKTERFQEAVENGYLTQDQADERMERMKEKMERRGENEGGHFGRL